MTINRQKELAMYFAGAMGWHALTHAVLAAIRTEEPHKSLGIRMTPPRNAVAAVVWAGVSVALIQYAAARNRQLAAM